MKKHIYNSFFLKVLCVVAVIISLHSCTDKFEEYNSDKSAMMSVGTKELSGLLSYAQIEGNNWLTTDNYNRMTRTVTNHLSGYMCIVDITYEQNMLNLGYHSSGFTGIFAKAIPALQCIFDLTKDNSIYQNEYAIALVWKVFLLHQVTDLWGPIPYTEGGTGKMTVSYESQKDVYYLMFDDLKKAIDIMTATVASNCYGKVTAYGVGDMILQWESNQTGSNLPIHFVCGWPCVSPMLTPTKAKTEAEAAASGITMDATTDDAFLEVSKWNNFRKWISKG